MFFDDTSSGLDGGGSAEAVTFGAKDYVVIALAHLKLVSRNYFTAKHIPPLMNNVPVTLLVICLLRYLSKV